MGNRGKKIFYSVLVIFVIALLGIKFVPYFWHHLPLGYDPGFYRAAFLSYIGALPYFDFSAINPWIRQMYEPLMGSFAILTHVIGFSPDVILAFGMPVLSGFVALCVYLVLKPYGKKYAIIGSILFLISIVQYKTFWLSYLKQILGIIFMLVGISMFDKKKYFLLIPLLIAAFSIQRPTGVFFLGMLIVYMLVRFIQYRKLDWKLVYIILGAGLVAIWFYMPLFNDIILPLINPLLNTVLAEGTSGTFFSMSDYIHYAWPYLLLATVGFVIRVYKNKSLDLLDAGFVFGVIWVFLRLYFYNRMMVFLDLFSILLAAWTLGYFLSRKRGRYLLGSFVIGQTIWFSFFFSQNNRPLADIAEIQFLSDVKNHLPKGSLFMVTDSGYSPWAIGYTGLPVMAPGLLDRDPRTKAQWFQWRDGDGRVKCDMLKKAKIQKHDVYMYQGLYQRKTNFENGTCFQVIYVGKGFYLFNLNFDTND